MCSLNGNWPCFSKAFWWAMLAQTQENVMSLLMEVAETACPSTSTSSCMHMDILLTIATIRLELTAYSAMAERAVRKWGSSQIRLLQAPRHRSTTYMHHVLTKPFPTYPVSIYSHLWSGQCSKMPQGMTRRPVRIWWVFKHSSTSRQCLCTYMFLLCTTCSVRTMWPMATKWTPMQASGSTHCSSSKD